MERDNAPGSGLGAGGGRDPYSTSGLMSGRARAGGPGFDDDDDTNLCWEITRVLLIVCAILTLVVGGAYWLSMALEPGRPSTLVSHDVGRELGEDDE